MKIFLISPVAKAQPEEQERIAVYVAQLEQAGHKVHWPIRDTEQNDPTGGYECCKTNFQAIIESDEIHIWYNESSGGSKFDMGGVFMLVEMLGWDRKVVLVDEGGVAHNTTKNFCRVFKHLIEHAK